MECNVHTTFRNNKSLGTTVERSAYTGNLARSPHKPNVYPQIKHTKRFIKHAISFQHVNLRFVNYCTRSADVMYSV